mgnify:CR=1 FL=1
MTYKTLLAAAFIALAGQAHAGTLICTFPESKGLDQAVVAGDRAIVAYKNGGSVSLDCEEDQPSLVCIKQQGSDLAVFQMNAARTWASFALIRAVYETASEFVPANCIEQE